MPPAKFFVNRGIVTSRTDLLNVLRPLEKQTVVYRHYRGHGLVQQGMGWIERIVADDPLTSTFFTPLSICINVDSWEHLEFETRADQLLVYTLVQGDEHVTLEFSPMVHGTTDEPVQQSLRLDPLAQYIQMELSVGDDQSTNDETHGEGSADGGGS